MTLGSSSLRLPEALAKESRARGRKGISCNSWEAHTAILVRVAKGGQGWGGCPSAETSKVQEGAAEGGTESQQSFPARCSGQPRWESGMEEQNRTATPSPQEPRLWSICLKVKCMLLDGGN